MASVPKDRPLSMRDLDFREEINKIKEEFNACIVLTTVKNLKDTNCYDKYQALVKLIRNRLISNWINSRKLCDNNNKTLYVITLDINAGRSLLRVIINLDIKLACYKALAELGIDLDELLNVEETVYFGREKNVVNSCFLNSVATLGIPCIAYGLKFKYGPFNQKLIDGHQHEEANDLSLRNEWEVARLEDSRIIKFHGKAEKEGTALVWKKTNDILAVPFDEPVSGFKNKNVNTIRLWSGKSLKEYVKCKTNGDYLSFISNVEVSENITRMIQLDDVKSEENELILMQKYFLVSASLQDIMENHKQPFNPKDKKHIFENLFETVAIEINDSTSLAILELMKLLMEKSLSWEAAWAITVKTISFTKESIEHFEKWRVNLMEKVLPYHMQIAYEINNKFMQEVNVKYPNDLENNKAMSLIENEGEEKVLNMINLAILGCHTVTGISEEFKNKFNEIMPEKFKSKKIGVCPHYWLISCNSYLASEITEKIGKKWVTNSDHLVKIKNYITDPDFFERISRLKFLNKQRFSSFLKTKYGTLIDPSSIFQVHVNNNIEENKRYLLNCLRIICLYNKIKLDKIKTGTSRTFFLGGKAAPGDTIGKLVIKFISDVAKTINSDNEVAGKLKVIYLENYCDKMGEMLIPATDIYEEISAVNTQTSGVNNIKFLMNGALIIGAQNRTNLDIRKSVGDSMFLFGMTQQEVKELTGYNPFNVYYQYPDLKYTIDQIKSGYFSFESRDASDKVHKLLMYNDRYYNLADFASYMKCQDEVTELYSDRKEFSKTSLSAIASLSTFCSDKAVLSYATDVWGTLPLWYQNL